MLTIREYLSIMGYVAPEDITRFVNVATNIMLVKHQCICDRDVAGCGLYPLDVLEEMLVYIMEEDV